jgi:hypothetical protein
MKANVSDNPHPKWKQARCKWCGLGLPIHGMVHDRTMALCEIPGYLLNDGIVNVTENVPCTAPSAEAYIVELEQERDDARVALAAIHMALDAVDKWLSEMSNADPARAEADSGSSYLRRQIEFSRRAFGEGRRTLSITKHIEKEIAEVRANPTDLSEWVDIIILAMDGFWRHGGTPEGIMPVINAKLEKNIARTWPAPTSEDATEHDRSADVEATMPPAQPWRPLSS